MAKQFDAFHNAILAKRKSTNPVITCRAQLARALITLHDGGILWMVGAIQHRLITIDSCHFCLARRFASVAVSAALGVTDAPGRLPVASIP